MHFRLSGLSPLPFQHLYGLPEAELTQLGVIRYLVDTKPGYPDRITMEDAEPGQTVLLLNHVCQAADTPYRASHAIFIREGATQQYDAVDQVPASLRIRLLSLRAYDARGMMVWADVRPGTELEAGLDELFALERTDYVHLHYAKPGCYACRAVRA